MGDADNPVALAAIFGWLDRDDEVAITWREERLDQLARLVPCIPDDDARQAAFERLVALDPARAIRNSHQQGRLTYPPAALDAVAQLQPGDAFDLLRNQGLPGAEEAASTVLQRVPASSASSWRMKRLSVSATPRADDLEALDELLANNQPDQETLRAAFHIDDPARNRRLLELLTLPWPQQYDERALILRFFTDKKDPRALPSARKLLKGGVPHLHGAVLAYLRAVAPEEALVSARAILNHTWDAVGALEVLREEGDASDIPWILATITYHPSAKGDPWGVIEVLRHRPA